MEAARRARRQDRIVYTSLIFFLGDVDRHTVDPALSLHRPLKRCIASLGDSLHTLLV
jgi:hypothetical protein